MISFDTWVFIGLIVMAIAVIIRIVAEKRKQAVIELAAIVLVPIVGFLFSDSDPIDIRAMVIAYSLVIYVISTLTCHIAAWLIKSKAQNKRSTSGVVPQEQEGLTVTLPVNYAFHIDQNFIDNLPADVDSLTYMCNEIGVLTTDFTNRFPELTTDQEREEIIRSYFLGICYHILDLFDDSVRVHVRILKKYNENNYKYEKFVATFNKNEYSRSMQPMSGDNQMIQTSYRREQSLIASLNKTLCEPGSNRKWKNFLTFALHSVTYEGRPVFSMGISTARTKVDRLFFLNYCSIETIIEKYIEMMVNTKGCKKFIIEHYFSSS